MITLSDNHAFYAFEPGLTAALSVAQGDEFTLATRDCFANQLRSSTDTLEQLDWDRINPATGPVRIEGVQPGDLVRIQIRRLQPVGNAVMTTIPGSGALSGITEASTTIVENGNGTITLPTERGPLTLPAKPMIGVIGLAPAEGKIPNGTPGVHGGNMDCTLIGEGATLYLRAAVEGGMFGCGDSHSLMGDGEVLVVGAETPALVTLVADVVDEPKLPVPFLENDDLYAVIASAPSSDDAFKLACDLMFGFLTEVVKLSANDTGRLMTLVGDLKFCQVVDPALTVRFEFPRSVLAQLGFTGIAKGGK
ncbi:MAG: acetamidase/formamidase family protein [Coriobacteriales bacterium]|nr:acetamidase/formamidase family protein [Coriobacteriales bacterium]